MAHTITHQEQEHDMLTAAFVLSLIAGLWSLAMDSMSRQGVFGSWMPAESIWPIFSVSVGLLILAGAILICIKPCHRHTWGTLIVLASALDFMFGAGGILGGVLGVIGGIVAIAS
jgi:hypothetical protein